MPLSGHIAQLMCSGNVVAVVQSQIGRCVAIRAAMDCPRVRTMQIFVKWYSQEVRDRNLQRSFVEILSQSAPGAEICAAELKTR